MAKSDPDVPRRQGYHHGNLREALVVAARNLIAERGPAGFTLIEAARRAGVSGAAPYRHFKDRDALVAEVCRRGFEEFGRRLSAAWIGAETDPISAFGRMGQAYLAFAREEPGYYAAMFAPGPTRTPRLPGEAAGATFARLRDAIGRITGNGRQGGVDLGLLAHEVWALSHGIATLAAAGLLGPDAGAPSPSDILSAGVGKLIAGAIGAAEPRQGPGPAPRRRPDGRRRQLAAGPSDQR